MDILPAENLRRLAAALRGLGDGVFAADGGGAVVVSNAVAETLTGWSAAEAVGRPLDEVLRLASDRTDGAIDGAFARFRATADPAAISDRTILVGRDGRRVPVALTGTPILREDGLLEGVIVVIRDVSGERAAQEAVWRSQRLLQAISDNSSAVIYAKDLDGHYLYVNRSFEELLGVKADTFLGKTDYDLFSREEAEVFRGMDRQVAADGAPLTREEPVPLADGMRTYLSVKSPLRDDAGRVYAIFGVSTDITDRKRAEEALGAEQTRTRLIIDTALDAVITIDAAGAIVDWSPQAEQMFGWSRTEALGLTLAETIVPERYREAHRRGIAHFLATGEGPVLNRRIELSALRRDGTEFPIELAITPLRTERSISFAAFVRDITDRTRMEKALDEGRRHYQALAESLPQLVWTCQPDGACDYLSGQWADYTGRPAAEQLGYGWAEHLHPDDRDRVRVEWHAAAAGGDHFDTEFRIRRADGEYRWFKTRARPLRDDSGTIVKWFGSNTDVEDYKRAEQKLHDQIERLNLLDQLTRAIGERQDLESVLQVVLRRLEDQLPLDFACVATYDRADESLVIARVGIRSLPLATDLAMTERARIPIDRNGLSRCVRGQLVYEEDLASVDFALPQRLAGGGLGSLVAAPLVVESQVFGVLLAARRQSHAFSSQECEFLRQLSEHVALAAQQAQLYTALQQAYDDLRQTQQAVAQQERLRALGQMASGIAHDINNAITPLGLCTEVLLESETGLSAEGRTTVAMMQHAVDDVAHTVAGLRDFYREQPSQPPTATVDLNALCREVLGLTRARWSDMPQQRGVSIGVLTELASEPALVRGVESELRQALINLVFNAVDAMPEGGTITLRTRPVGGRAVADRVFVEVSDTGVGMSADTRERCLDPFFTTKGERGTGLGLAMVYGVVQRHGAEIELESEVGRGTTVRLAFPAPPAGPAGAVAVSGASRPASLRILVVDDDPILLKSMRTALELDGHRVTTMEGGQAGIDAFARGEHDGTPFAVVITDLGMPYVDGRRVAATIKAQAPRTPLILLTGWGQRMIEDRDIPIHVDRVLAKPPRLGDLRRVLAELTAGRSPGTS